MQVRRKYNGARTATTARNRRWRQVGRICEACGCETMLVWLVQKHRNHARLSHGGGVVSWKDGTGVRHRRPVATVDHVLPKWRGGRNRRNLQVLCYSCHTRKSKREMEPHRKWPRGVCRKCGKLTEDPRRRKCDRCRNNRTGRSRSRRFRVPYVRERLQQPLAPILSAAMEPTE